MKSITAHDVSLQAIKWQLADQAVITAKAEYREKIDSFRQSHGGTLERDYFTPGAAAFVELKAVTDNEYKALLRARRQAADARRKLFKLAAVFADVIGYVGGVQ